ncbi:MAG: nucleotidyl transferase AbiEii/AbiGii toxin family protein [Planctomycetota bacterium]|nr:nucleotidyl transferase AbiEii/AbiGii toxin family protein [Planctomycetota bacterium]
MIDPQCFTRSWIDAKREEMGGGDPTLIEKTIHAFALLCHLARRDVPLVFKGGTSLMLRLPRPRRLSIDVDILCPLPNGELDPILAEVGRTAPFLRHEEDPRDPNRLPARRHFKFFYTPCDANNPAPHVLLDVVREQQVYPHTGKVSVQSPLFLVEEEVRVEVPTMEGLLGDKLAAFAPNTVGVPCREESAMQVMKHLFDVGALFDAATDFTGVAQAYDAIFRVENGYRSNRFTREAALTDTMETARRLCHVGLKGAVPHEHQRLLEVGRRAVASHLIGGTLTRDEAKVAAAKAAFLAAALRDGTPQAFAPGFRYEPLQTARLATATVADPVLQRLRGGNPEAFHYWAMVGGTR